MHALSLIKSYNEEHLAKSIKTLMQNGVMLAFETIKNLLEQKEIISAENFYYLGIDIGELCMHDKLLGVVWYAADKRAYLKSQEPMKPISV